MFIGYIKFTNQLLLNYLPQKILNINEHYALVIKNKFFVLSTSPSKYLISDKAINNSIMKKQYLWSQCYQFDLRVIKFSRIRHADTYLIDHFNKFQSVLKELDFQNVIDLTKFLQ